MDKLTEKEGDELPFHPAWGCALSMIVGALGVGFMYMMISLAVGGEIRWGREPSRANRIWLVESEGQAGIGWSSASEMETVLPEADVCIQQEVRFLLWSQGFAGEVQKYCDCYRRIGDELEILSGCTIPVK